MDEVTKNMVTAQLKSAKTDEALHDALVSAIIAMSLLAAFCAYANSLTFARATALLAVAVAISIVGNVARMLLILTVAAFAPDFGFGLWHDLCGYVVFVFAVLAMASVASKLALSEQHLIDGKTGGK